MSYIIIHQQPDGTVALTALPAEATLEDATAEAGRLTHIGELCAIKHIDDLPKLDRYFRPAYRWDVNAGTLTYDLPACRDRHLQKLRRLRKPKLAEADINIARESDQGDTPRLNALRSHRQRLRDFPVHIQPHLDAASSPEAIKAVWPSVFDEAP